MNIRYGKPDLQFLFGIFASIFIFYPDFFWARSGFLVADHLWQHYPWAELFWKSIHHFKLPFWTPLIHCGLPIAAESQIGIFYPINLLLYFLLPLHWAHSYMNLVHFFLVGCALYFYARQIGFKPLGSFISAFLFLFGAAHGGAFYNITSLKTIAWLPLGLFLFEKTYQEGKWRYLVCLPFVFAMTLIAGYMQMGILCIFMFVVYAFLRIFVFSDLRKFNLAFRLKMSFRLGLSMLFTFVLALPQIWLTYPLALLSNRAGVVEEYAYVGSMFPAAITTVFFPHWNNMFRGNNLYMGIFSIFLVLAAFNFRNKSLNQYFKLWCLMGLIGLLMALGQWSPFYIAFVKLTHFYSFRTPAKFLVFICLSLSVLGGLGFQTLWDLAKNQKTVPKVAKIGWQYLTLCLIFVAAALFMFAVFKLKREEVLKAGDWFVTSFLYGKAGHSHTMDYYQNKFGKYVDYFLGLFSPQFWNIWSVGMISMGIVFSLWLVKIKKGLCIWLIAGFIFLFVDLYAFAFVMFKGGFNDYKSSGEIKSPVVQYLVREQEKRLISRVYGFNYRWKLVPVLPSLNMIYNYADIGAYSPFVIKRYYETIGLMGNVNDSNSYYWPEPEFVINHLNLLKLTGVSHILSLQQFNHPDFDLLTQDPKSNLFLYRFKPVHSKAFFVSDLKVTDDWEKAKQEILNPNFNPFAALIIEKSEVDKLDRIPNSENVPEKESQAEIISERLEIESERWRITTNQPGYFVVANSYYPGWRAWVNGRPVKILKAYGLFQAVPIAESGSSVIEFRFFPFSR